MAVIAERRNEKRFPWKQCNGGCGMMAAYNVTLKPSVEKGLRAWQAMQEHGLPKRHV